MTRPTEGLLVIQKYTYYFLFLMKWPCMTDKTPRVLIYLFNCLSWISVFLPLHMTICTTKTVFDRLRIDSMINLTTIGLEGAWFFFSFLGMVNFKNRQSELVDLMNVIDDKFKWRSAPGKTYVNMEKIHKLAKMISMVWQLFPAATVFVTIINPLLEKPIRLPVPCWYPIDVNNTNQFIFAYLIQSWTKMVMVSSFACGSSFYISFTLFCCGQFNILRCDLKNLIYSTGVSQRFPELQQKNSISMEDPAEYVLAHEIEETPPPPPEISKSSVLLNNHNLTPEEVKSFRKGLRSCVQHQLVVIRVCTMMEEFLNIFAFLRVGEMTLQICFLAFMYAKTADMISLILVILTFIDLFLITYPADYIMSQSTAVGTSLMAGPWYLFGKEFKNELIIIMACSMRPIHFTAGKVLKLNTDRFRTVITTAFSYYTLLSSFDKK